MIPYVYLAGPIAGLTYQGCTDWREYAKKELALYGLPAFSPMRGKEYLEAVGAIKDAYDGATDPLMRAISGGAGTITRDRNDVRNAGAMIANLKGAQKVSIGTVVECGWADAYRKPVIAVMEPGNVHDHAFVREIAGYVVEELDHALFIARTILLPDPGRRIE